jgi:hypothetical protein
MISYSFPQGEAEWLKMRTAKVTASEVGEATAFLKVNRSPKKVGDSSDTRDKYIRALAGEILTGNAAENFVSKWMERGSALEPMAREEYSMREGVTVKQVGFVVHPTISRSGASPDGLVYSKGVLLRGLELKAPKLETHLGYMLDGVLPAIYEPQVMWGLACCPELPEWDFVSFCAELPEDLQQFKIRVPRNQERIAELEAGVLRTLADADDLVARIRAMAVPFPSRPVREVETTPLPRTYSGEVDESKLADQLFGQIEQ